MCFLIYISNIVSESTETIVVTQVCAQKLKQSKLKQKYKKFICVIQSTTNNPAFIK